MSSTVKVRIWDGPTRLFHWMLVLLVGFSWLSAKMFWMQLHFLSGEAVLALLLFRIVWGFVGSDSARFVRFLKSPMAAIAHLKDLPRREPDTELGHNAAGGWMVVGLLVLLLLQVGSGLFGSVSIDEVEGPLRHRVSADIGEWLGNLHGYVFTGIQIAVAGHITAIVVYLLLKGHNLVRPMIVGTKDIPDPVSHPRMAHPVLAAGILGAAAAAVILMLRYL